MGQSTQEWAKFSRDLYNTAVKGFRLLHSLIRCPILSY